MTQFVINNMHGREVEVGEVLSSQLFNVIRDRSSSHSHIRAHTSDSTTPSSPSGDVLCFQLCNSWFPLFRSVDNRASTHTSPTPPLLNIQTLPSFILSLLFISCLPFCPWHLINHPVGLLDTIRNHNGIPHQIYRYCYHYRHLDI